MKNSGRIRRNRIQQWRISWRRRSQQSETGRFSNLNAIFINQEGEFEASGLSLRSPQSGKRVREPPDSSWKYRTAFLIPKSVTSASESNGTAHA